jgi:predicted transcriptional regulator
MRRFYINAGRYRNMTPTSRLRLAADSFVGTVSGLGPLESKVLDVVWKQTGEVTVRHIQLAFPGLAYTTLMTTLDRLFRKGILVRRRRGRAFTYEQRCSRNELVSELVSGHVTDLITAVGASTAVLSTLVHVLGRSDVALLDQLELLVQAERRRLKAEGT